MSRLESSIRRTARRSWSCCAICTATARPFAWLRTIRGTRISPSATFICSMAASWRKRRKPESEPDPGRQFMETIWQDARFGLRMLLKHRITTIVCVAALALGIGANAAIFSLAEAFLLHPAPFQNPSRTVALVDARVASDGGGGFGPQDLTPVAPATFLDWRKEVHSFDDLAAYAWDAANLTGDREAQKVQDFQITANFFPMIGVQPLLGRTFLPEEEKPGRNQEIILSYGLWEQRYASDPNILKRVIKVDGKSFNVVGVMKKGFDFPMPAEAWIPLALSTKERVRRDNRHLWVLGRLKPGVSFSERAADRQSISERQAQA